MSVFYSVSEQITQLRRKAPTSIALSDSAGNLNYVGFDFAAQQFANYLMHLGISRGDTVAIVMERSFDWVIAALGTMRAGAAYVPLDAGWPKSRLSFAVRDCRASMLVARSSMLESLQVGVPGIDPKRDAAAIASSPEMPEAEVDPEGLAYIIYTSGSTGVPKGVEVTHANLANLITWHRETFQVDLTDRASHLAGLGFDAAVWEIWSNLAAGAELCLADDIVRFSPELLQQWILRKGISISFVPTVQASQLMAMDWPSSTSLRLLLTGGEALHQMPPIGLPFIVVNNYGPTECTVVATSTVLKPGSAGPPPIGRPIGNTSIYLLDHDLQPVPDFTVGDIFIGGEGVARGYRNLPEATEKSFLPDPFSGVLQARMYRTGDRGLLRADGEIAFRGRLDRQASIRGHRIELDEIDSVLNSQPGIDFGTAVTRKGAHGDDEIVAYVLPTDESHVPALAELTDELLKVLPEFMLPATFVRLESVPLSKNGKVDFDALPFPSKSNTLKRGATKAAESLTQKRLLDLVRKLLNHAEISVDDNFFLAGGHSLLGMQMVIQLRNAFDVDFSLQELYIGPTVERLASLVDQKLAEKCLTVLWRDILNKQHVGRQTSFFEQGGNDDLLITLQQRILKSLGRLCTISELTDNPTIDKQAGLISSRGDESHDLPAGVLPLRTNPARNAIFWIHYLSTNLARAMAEDQAFIHVGLTREDIERLGPRPKLDAIAATFVQKILATQQQGPYIIGGYCLGGILAYEVSSQLRASRRDVPLLVMLDTPSPSYFESRNTLAPRLRHPRYLLKRASRIGFKSTLQKISKRLITYFEKIFNAPSNRTELEHVQYLVEAAAALYEARTYGGNVALILASDRPPHIDFLSEWRELVPDGLHSQYLVAHHSELMSGSAVQSVADVMAALMNYAANDAVEAVTITQSDLPRETQETEIETLVETKCG